MDRAEALLRDMFAAAVAAADPMRVLAGHLPDRPAGRVLVVGAGKASARMAQAVEAAWGPCDGLVIVPHGAALPTRRIEIVEAGHPVPDAAGAAAGRRMLDMVAALGPDDMALCLVSGGGSALLSVPGPGLTLADKQAVNAALLKSGASISRMNTLRKHLSSIKGGRLAVAAHPAQVVTLTISDVPGDDPSVIASGPTVPDATTLADARAISERHGIDLPAGALSETPGADHPVFARARMHMIARLWDSLLAAAEVARAAGVTPLILGDALEGEARELGIILAGIARSVIERGHPVPRPAVILSGGETTVTVRGIPGKGGRNTESLLSFGLYAPDGVQALFADTDGIDGSEDNAGAVWTPALAARAHVLGARGHLDGHDAYSFFAKAGALVETGPTHTNVNDFRAVLIA